MPDGPRRRVLWVLGGAAAGVALGTGLLAAWVFPAASGRRPSHVATKVSGPASPPTAGQPSPAASPDSWWKPLPAASSSFVPARIVFEKLHVDAPIEVKGVDSQNQMQAPDRPGDAAWYRFTARPGSGSNAVFSGHRDFAKVGPAIFWHLDQMAPGDLIDVVSGQQTELWYRVVHSWNYSVKTIPMRQVLAADAVDEVTIITCSGAYTPSTGYDHRLVVRAVRVP